MGTEALRQPAEWSPHDAVWLAWPSHEALWGAALPEVRRSFTAFARAITRDGGERLEVLCPDAAQEAGIDAAMDATDAARPPDAAPEAGADVAADASCAGAVAGEACAAEGTFCGGPCTNPCAFCNVLRCAGGRWGRIEVPPLPPDMCRDAGPDAADAGGLNCDPRTAACDSLPPPCMGGGEGREVRGACWGECVVYDRCRPIPCDPAMTGQCPTNTVCFRTTRQCGLPVF